MPLPSTKPKSKIWVLFQFFTISLSSLLTGINCVPPSKYTYLGKTWMGTNFRSLKTLHHSLLQHLNIQSCWLNDWAHHKPFTVSFIMKGPNRSTAESKKAGAVEILASDNSPIHCVVNCLPIGERIRDTAASGCQSRLLETRAWSLCLNIKPPWISCRKQRSLKTGEKCVSSN